MLYLPHCSRHHAGQSDVSRTFVEGGMRPTPVSIFVNLLICYAAIGEFYANRAKVQGDCR